MIDWNHIRAHRASTESPAGWPVGVRSISLDGVSLLGVHEQTNRLYWDGREIEFKRIELGLYERIIGAVVAIGTFGPFALEIGKRFAWWS